MPTTKDEQKPRSLKRPFWLSLLLISLALFTTLFAISYRKYTSWYLTTRPSHRTNDHTLHTACFIATCAPLSLIFGIAVSAMYYVRKRRKYGKYDVMMRRKGRGYCVDASDAVDLRMMDEARRVNAAKKEQMRKEAPKKEEEVGGQMLMLFSWVQGEEQRISAQTKRVSFFSNPYGWVMKEDGKGKGPERALGRTDSVRTCEDDEVTRKGVKDIWLGRSGTEGKNKGKGKWDEGMEMESMRKTA
jgi:hypothetical protein